MSIGEYRDEARSTSALTNREWLPSHSRPPCLKEDARKVAKRESDACSDKHRAGCRV